VEVEQVSVEQLERPVGKEKVEVALDPHQVEDLPRAIPRLLDEVRGKLSRLAGRRAPEVVIDLSAVPPVPACSPLLLLFRLVRRLLRRSVGPDARVVVTGVGPALWVCTVFHDVVWGALFATYFTYAADLAPPLRRAEAIAMFGVAGMTANGVAPIIGERVIDAGGYGAYFALAMVLGLGSVVISFWVPSGPMPVAQVRMILPIGSPSLR